MTPSLSPFTPPAPRLLADIGGTNARFAWQAGPGLPLESELTLACAEHGSLSDALLSYLQLAGRSMPPACALAIANPVVGDRVSMTNHHWSFSLTELHAQLGLDELLVVNDFTALALALPSMDPADLRQVGGRAPLPGWAIGLIGPGTGLGVSGLLPDGRGGWLPVQGEGGHATMGATTARERAVLEFLAIRHGHVSAERAVCGQGLVDIHKALTVMDEGADAMIGPAPTAAEITAAALDGRSARADESLDLFCAFLGIAAGNLALTLGAKGGVYVGGGIVPRLGARFERSPFRQRFEAKGRLSAFVADIPVYVIDARSSPAFLGVANALDSQVGFAGRVRRRG
ncbi:MAG: glucokinase [Rubrivivax sp.]|jgi:glucokinase|nr:glucokinase [Rubrivivax sp.]